MIQPVSEVVEQLTAMGPHLTFEDMPISLALYPWVTVDNGVCRIDWPGQKRHGQRWGMSGTWDRQTDHYMLPMSVLNRKTPLRGYVTAHQVFDFIYTPESIAQACLKNNHYHRSQRIADRLSVRIGDLDPDEAILIYDQAHSSFAHDAYRQRLLDLLHVLPAAYLSPYVMTMQLLLDGVVIGWLACWIEAGQCTSVLRYVTETHKNHTRWFDNEFAQVCARNAIKTISQGDAHRNPGLTAYKFSLSPVELRPYFNVLAHEEEMDCNGLG